MYSIPEKAFKLGAETLNEFPVTYGKARVSGSNNTSYFLHSKGGCMPGQTEIFIKNGRSNPGFDKQVNENTITRAFKYNQKSNKFNILGPKHLDNCLTQYTYSKYYPYDDCSLAIAINSSYRQIFGNLYPMESQRPIEIERRLRNGDIHIKEFIRQLAKSPFYISNYFQIISQPRSIELTTKHILGRPPINQSEIIKSVELITQEGFHSYIDYLIDSDEYNSIFGEDTVPYMRCWNSPCGSSTSYFINSSKLNPAFATSDNIILSKNK